MEKLKLFSSVLFCILTFFFYFFTAKQKFKTYMDDYHAEKMNL